MNIMVAALPQTRIIVLLGTNRIQWGVINWADRFDFSSTVFNSDWVHFGVQERMSYKVHLYMVLMCIVQAAREHFEFGDMQIYNTF